MAKIIDSASGPIPPDPNDPVPVARDGRKEVTVTSKPKTRAQRQANAKAQGLSAAAKRQEQNAYAPRKQSESQRTAQRKRARDLYHHSVQTDLAAGKITAEQAKARLTKRRGPDTADL